MWSGIRESNPPPRLGKTRGTLQEVVTYGVTWVDNFGVLIREALNLHISVVFICFRRAVLA